MKHNLKAVVETAQENSENDLYGSHLVMVYEWNLAEDICGDTWWSIYQGTEQDCIYLTNNFNEGIQHFNNSK